VDVRVIAATHRDLEKRITEGAFREDLYYRLNVANIVIPPLRERRDEIIPLAALFLKKHKNADPIDPVIGPELRAALLEYYWPGNIRELENVMRRFVVLRDAGVIIEELKDKAKRELSRRQTVMPRHEVSADIALSDANDRPAEKADVQRGDIQVVAGSSDGQGSGLAQVNETRKKAETEVIIQALNSTLWNRKRAAALLHTDYKALLYKMKKLGIG
jgi:two-component system response regulator AtoC